MKGFTPETPNQSKLKMYILVRDSVPDEFAPVVSAHGALGCYLKFNGNPFMSKWVNGVFYKVVCRVSDKEFEAAKKFENVHVQTEAGLGGIEATVTLCPRYDWAKPVRFYKLWKPNYGEVE